MADLHITVVSVVPTEAGKPDTAATGTASDTGVPAIAFATLLGERLDALVPRADRADDALAEARRDDDTSQAPAAIATEPPLVLAQLPGLPQPWSPQPAGESDAAVAAKPASLAFAPTLPERAPSVGTPFTMDRADTVERLVADPLAQRPADQGLLAEAPTTPPAERASLSVMPMQPPPAPAPAPAPVVAAAVTPHVRGPEWREAVTERIAIFVRDRIPSAELHVQPPELGPISVRIDVSGTEANVVFGVQHPETRIALTEALPRLAELLAANGIALAGAHVGAEFQSQRDRTPTDPGDRDGGSDAAQAAAPLLVRRGLVDIFV